MQNPCRLFFPLSEALRRLAVAAARAGLLALAVAGPVGAAPEAVSRVAPLPPVAAPAPVPPVPGVAPVQPAGAREILEFSVRQWVGKQQGMAPALIDIAPLDPRLNIQPCRQPLAMDLPFASAETVRVRCGAPAWQVYVRVSAAGRPLAQPGAAGEKSVVSTGKRRVVVAAVPLQRGMQLSESLVILASVDRDNLYPPPLEQLSQVNHVELLRDVAQGAPIRSADIRPVVLVRRGQLVQLQVGQERGFQITAMVEAMEDGRMGDQVKLKNRESGRIVSGVVRGPNQVQGW